MNSHEFQFLNHKERLKNILEYAYSNIPFYKISMNHHPSYYTKSYFNWTQLPLVTKGHIQNESSSFVNKESELDRNNYMVMHTSGSTGIPLRILKDKKEELRLTKRLWKHRREYNSNIMKKKLLYLYRDVESKHLKVLRIGNDDYVDLSERMLEKSTVNIQEFEPDWAIGSPSVMVLLANYFSESKKVLPSLKLVELYGEMVYPYQRKIIEEAFDCKVINHYGMREFGVMSYECPEGKMHAWDDDLFFEVLNDGIPVEDGTSGELVVTSLTNPIMPLIRYRVGDLVKLNLNEEYCGCCKSGLLLVPTTGRISQFLRTPTKTLPSVMFDTEFSRFIIKYPNSIKGFQVIQENIHNINILIVRGKDFKHSCLQELHKNFMKYATDLTYNFKFVDSVKPDSFGKTRTFISKIERKSNDNEIRI